MPKTMIDCALESLSVADDLLCIHRKDNDIGLGYAAFALQQTVEMSLQAILERNGFELEELKDSLFHFWYGAKNLVPELFPEDVAGFLEEQFMVFTVWRDMSRYPSEFDFAIKTLEEFYGWIVKFYNIAAEYCGGTQFTGHLADKINNQGTIKPMSLF